MFWRIYFWTFTALSILTVPRACSFGSAAVRN